MDYLRIYVLSKSVSVISGRWMADNERLCAMETRLRLKISRDYSHGSSSKRYYIGLMMPIFQPV